MGTILLLSWTDMATLQWAEATVAMAITMWKPPDHGRLSLMSPVKVKGEREKENSCLVWSLIITWLCTLCDKGALKGECKELDEGKLLSSAGSVLHYARLGESSPQSPALQPAVRASPSANEWPVLQSPTADTLRRLVCMREFERFNAAPICTCLTTRH